MAGAVTIRSRPSEPEAIDATLTALWREAGRTAPLTRALLSNLVVVRERGRHEATDLTLAGTSLPLEAIVQQHPCRVIVIHHAAGCATRQKPIAASANIVCFESGAARFGIEAIVVSSECAEASLPSLVRRLVVGDVPTTLWCPDDFSRTPPLDELFDMARQVVYDSRTWRDVRAAVRELVRLLGRPYVPDLADLNWRRLRPLRQALTQAASPAIHASDVRTVDVQVHHRPGDGALAWLLVGWLDSRLAAERARRITVDEMRQGDEVLAVSFGGAAVDLSVTMNGHRVLVRFPNHTAPIVVAVPREPTADAVASELRSLGHDRCLHDALRALASRLESAST